MSAPLIDLSSLSDVDVIGCDFRSEVVATVVGLADGCHSAETHHHCWCVALNLPVHIATYHYHSQLISVRLVGLIDFDGYVYADRVSAGCAVATETVMSLAAGERL